MYLLIISIFFLTLTRPFTSKKVRLTPAWAPPLACFGLAAAAYTRRSDSSDRSSTLGQRIASLLSGSMDTNQAFALVGTLAAGSYLLAYAGASFRLPKPPSKLKPM